MSRSLGLSDKGHIRKGNEDAFVCVDDLQLFVVADGMGGHNAGEVASRLAVEAIAGFVRRSADGAEFSGPCWVDPDLSFDANRLRTAIHLANLRVFRAAEDHDAYTGMGTTVVAALLTGSRLIVGHVGDSRLYMRADGTLRQITQDDSWAATILVNELGDDRAALDGHPMRNALTNVLGGQELTDIHLSELLLRSNELLLLCTDGLYGSLDDRTIEGILAAKAGLAPTARMLVGAALDSGGRDNVTALLVQCDPAPA